MVNSGQLYLALGDSITAGYGVGRNNSFASIYSAVLRQQFPSLVYANLGVNGLTTGRLVVMLRSQRAQGLLGESGIVTITVGSNDLLAEIKTLAAGRQPQVDVALSNMANNLLLAGKIIRANNPQVVIKIATLYNPFPGGPFHMYAGQADAVILRANQILEHWARSFNFIPVPVYQAFLRRENLLLGADHLHPSLAGHRVLAEMFAQG